MLARGELDIEADVVSDTAPLNGLVAALLAAAPGVRALRDATRGGVATILNEIASAAGVGVLVTEDDIPVQPAVRGASELLGIDPMYVACEGRRDCAGCPARAPARPGRRHYRGGDGRTAGRRPAENRVRGHPDRGPAGRRSAAADLLKASALVHELAITEHLVNAVSERLPGAKVTCVRLEIGALAGVVADSLRFCFDLVTEGTNLEGAALEISQLPATCHCRVCGQDFEPASPIALCSCGSAEVTVLTGQDLKITSVQVA
jgi:hydrogenase nickel insertion protein HypA